MQQVKLTPVTTENEEILDMVEERHYWTIECALCGDTFEVENADSAGPEQMRRELVAEGWVHYETEGETGYAHRHCAESLKLDYEEEGDE